MSRRIVNLEINEIPPSLFLNYINNIRNKESTLKDLKDRNLLTIYTTKANDVSKNKLYPSQTWASFLTGKPYSEHKCYWYSDYIDYKDLLWSKLALNNKSSGILGSLHSSKIPNNLFCDSNFKFYIPDCFSSINTTKPREYKDFQSLNISLVNKAGRVTGLRNLIKDFLSYFLKLLINPRKFGISIFSLKMILRIIYYSFKYRNKELLRMAQFPLIGSLFNDLFLNHLPDYSSLFSNHIAGNMHRYWYAHDRSNYKIKDKYDEIWIKNNKHSINISFTLLDEYIKFLLKKKDFKDATILITSSMGQEPNPRFDERVLNNYSGKITNLKKFLFHLKKYQKKRYNLELDFKIGRNMAPQYGFYIPPNTDNIDVAFVSQTVRDFVTSIGLTNKVDFEGDSIVLTLNPNVDENLQKNYSMIDAINKYSRYGLEFFPVKDHHSGSHSPYGILVAINCTDKFKNHINQNIESDGKINYLNFPRIILDNA
tara:strand:- start:168 stop:1616 length:1449 start_codon:yes stop_codon:yes gene_type:complete